MFNDKIAEFAAHLRENERAAATVEKYVRDVKSFFAFLDSCHCEERSDVAISSLSKENVIAYKSYLTEHYAVRSVNSMIASLNSFFDFLGRSDLKLRSLKMQREVYCEESRELTRSEYERLCRAAEAKHNERLNLILQTICGTGIRVSELRFITVEAVRRGEAAVSLKGKTRTVLLVKPLQKKLLRYITERGIASGAVFVTRSGKPMSRTNIWREMKALCREADVDPRKVFPHNLRHLFARIFYGLDKDIAKLADILGHSSIDTTRIYIISSGTEHRRRMEAMHMIL